MVEAATSIAGRFFEIWTHHETVLAGDDTGGHIVSVVESAIGPAFRTIIGYASRVTPHSVFLFPAAFDPETSSQPTSIVSVGMAYTAAGVASFYDTRSGRWICALPPDQSRSPPRGELSASRTHIDIWERFRLNPLTQAAVPAAMVRAAARLDELMPEPFEPSILGKLAPGEHALLEALAYHQPIDVIGRFAQALVASPASCRAFAGLFPNDVHARLGLVPLADWLIRRDTPELPESQQRLGFFSALRARPAAAGTSDDFPKSVPAELAFLCDQEKAVTEQSFPHAILAAARATIVPRRTFCVVATARNEAIYLPEWVAYHRALGAGDIFLYSNDNDDGSDALLAAMARGGAVKWINNATPPGKNSQNKAYAHAFSFLPHTLDYRWALTIDLDEVLVFNPEVFTTVSDFLHWQDCSPAEAIGLNWMFVGACNQARWTEQSFFDRFPNPIGEVNAHVKCFSRTAAAVTCHPHHPRTLRDRPYIMHAEDQTIHRPWAAGDPHAGSAEPSARFAWINHYFFKSSEEFLLKFSRNRGDEGYSPGPTTTALRGHFVASFVDAFQRQDPSWPNPKRCAPELQTELARIMAMPGVARAWDIVKQTYRERTRTILPIFRDAPAMIEAGQAGDALLATLGMSRADGSGG